MRQHGTRNTATQGDPIVKLAALRAIAEQKQYAKIDGMMVDLFTASAIIKVYTAINEESHRKYLAMPLVRMAQVAFKLLR